MMYKVGFEPEAEKEFLALPDKDRALVAKKIIALQKGHFHKDKSLKGRHKGKFRKRAGNFRIIYLKEEGLLLITIIRIAHKKKVYF
ncbi:MAG: type II toxin-antitoxin system RelE/ParE family toxin [Desulfobacula sp.]|nr:type II toxin-antitoxin system RelE/ParE family toxin [Desulfobacula sp.]